MEDLSPQPTQSNSNTPIIGGVVVVALIAVLAVAALNYESLMGSPSPSPTNTEMSQPASIEESMLDSTTSGNYADGEYMATGTYTSPGGPESIQVSLTLTNGTVTAAEVVPQAELPASVNFQGQFAENYQEQVIGKNIDELMLTKVAGSSLTPKGFNDAVQQIRSQAQV